MSIGISINHLGIPISGIHLWRDDKYVYVEAEIGGKWYKVITELLDSQFSHIVEPLGMLREYEQRREDISPKRRVES